MTTINKYRVYCTTDSKNVEIWSANVPTTCPENNGHSINSSATTKIGSVSENKITINEETVEDGQTPSGGKFRCHGLDIVASPANSKTYHAICKFKYPISIISMRMSISSDNVGDIINGVVAKNTTIGTITADCNISDHDSGTNEIEMTVQQSVVDNIKTGYKVSLTDGTNTECFGECISIDKANLKITCEMPSAPSNNYASATPTHVRMSICMLENYKFISAGNQPVIGDDKIGGSLIPANTEIGIEYDNKDPSNTKDLHLSLQYLY